MRKINLKAIKQKQKVKLIKKSQQTQLKGGAAQHFIEEEVVGCG